MRNLRDTHAACRLSFTRRHFKQTRGRAARALPNTTPPPPTPCSCAGEMRSMGQAAQVQAECVAHVKCDMCYTHESIMGQAAQVQARGQWQSKAPSPMNSRSRLQQKSSSSQSQSSSPTQPPPPPLAAAAAAASSSHLVCGTLAGDIGLNKDNSCSSWQACA